MDEERRFANSDDSSGSGEHRNDSTLHKTSAFDFTRREFVATVTAATGGLALGLGDFASNNPVLAAPPDITSGEVSVALIINGQHHHLSLDPRVTLLDLLREDLGLTGTKKGCDHGQCGACTVLANGTRINSCLALAVSPRRRTDHNRRRPRQRRATSSRTAGISRT